MESKINRRTLSTLLLFCMASWTIAFWLGAHSRGGSPAAPVQADVVEEAEARSPGTREIANANRFMEFAATLGDVELSRILPEMTEKMGEPQVRESLQRLPEAVDPVGRRAAKFELIDRWAQLDPAAALGHITAMSDPKMRHDLHLRAIKGWASVDPAAAFEYSHTAEELPREASEAAWAGLAATKDLNAALDFVPGMELSEYIPNGKDSLVTEAVKLLYQNDDRAVVRWAEELHPGDVRKKSIMGVASGWAAHDPQAAIAWLEQHADPSDLAHARERVLSAWQSQDPAGVATWRSANNKVTPHPDSAND